MTTNLRLLEVIHDNRLGGISVRAMSVEPHLRQAGIQSIFVLPQEPGDVAETCRERGIPVHQILLKRPHPRRAWQSLKWMISFPWSVWLLVKLIRRQAVDAVHVNGFIGLQAAVAAKLTRTPLIWHLAGTGSYPRWFVRLLRPFLRSAECIIPISPNVESYFLTKGVRNRFSTRKKRFLTPLVGSRVIYEPVEIPSVDEDARMEGRRDVRRRLGLRDDDRVVCTVGNLSPVKGTLVLIDVARELCEKHDDVQFLVVGAKLETQSAYVASIERAIRDHGLEDRVRLLGKRNDVPQILQASDLFVLPSLSEGTPISILEAMASRVPIVASDVGGIPDQIQDGVSGRLTPAGDATALAGAVEQLLSDPARADAFRSAAFERVTSQFSLERYVRQFDAAVRAAVRQSPGACRFHASAPAA